MLQTGGAERLGKRTGARHNLAILLLLGQALGVRAAHAADKPSLSPLPVQNVATSIGGLDNQRGLVNAPGSGDSAGAEAALDAELGQLRNERANLTAVRNAAIREPDADSQSAALQREQLKQQLNGLMKEWARRPRPEDKPRHAATKRSAAPAEPQRGSRAVRKKKTGPERAKANPPEEAGGPATPGPVDSMALAQALFRTGDYNGALNAFELARKTTTNPQDRVVIRYFSAACLNKLGNTQEAMVLFREVANSRADEVLAECARWQLTAQQWKETTRARIEQLRSSQPGEESAAAKGTGTVESGPNNQDETTPQSTPAR